MSQQSGGFLSKLEQIDPEFHEAIMKLRTEPATGGLDAKTRALISLAVHMALAQGDARGAKTARSLGATDEEIKETLRLAFILRGMPAIITGLTAF